MIRSPKSTPALLFVAVLTALTFVAAACGGDDPEFSDDASGEDDTADGATGDSSDDDGGDGASGDDADGASGDGDDGTATDGASGDGAATDGADGGTADEGTETPTEAPTGGLPDPLPEPQLDVGQPTAEDAVFLYLVGELGLDYVGDCRNLDPADYETGTYCSVTDANTYTIGQAPDLVEATITVVEGPDGWIVESAVLS